MSYAADHAHYPPLASTSHVSNNSGNISSTSTSTKRRRVEQQQQQQQTNEPGYGYNIAPSTSRTAAKAAAAAASRANTQVFDTGVIANGNIANLKAKKEDAAALSLAALPPPALQRYLSRYGLLESHGSLSYHHAVFPVPPLPSTLPSPITGRQLTSRKAYKAPVSNNAEENDHNGSKRAKWEEPKTSEFRGLSAYDDPMIVTQRLAIKAKEHWDKRESVKEGETLTNFMFALRMRAHTLRATPPG